MGVGIVAERPMYFSFNGINSGTDALGSTQLGQDFYFADVEAQRNYSSFITILNPPGSNNANVTVSYLAGGTQIGHNNDSCSSRTARYDSPNVIGYQSDECGSRSLGSTYYGRAPNLLQYFPLQY